MDSNSERLIVGDHMIHGHNIWKSCQSQESQDEPDLNIGQMPPIIAVSDFYFYPLVQFRSSHLCLGTPVSQYLELKDSAPNTRDKIL